MNWISIGFDNKQTFVIIVLAIITVVLDKWVIKKEENELEVAINHNQTLVLQSMEIITTKIKRDVESYQTKLRSLVVENELKQKEIEKHREAIKKITEFKLKETDWIQYAEDTISILEQRRPKIEEGRMSYYNIPKFKKLLKNKSTEFKKVKDFSALYSYMRNKHEMKTEAFELETGMLRTSIAMKYDIKDWIQNIEEYTTRPEDDDIFFILQ